MGYVDPLDGLVHSIGGFLPLLAGLAAAVLDIGGGPSSGKLASRLPP